MGETFIRPQKDKPQSNPLDSAPALFEAALNEFSLHSFNSASLNDIIKASGLSKGSFYHRFTDKMDLYLCVMDVISQKKAAYMALPPSSGDFFEQLRHILHHSLGFAQQEPRFDAFWRRYLAEGPDVKEAVSLAFPNRGANHFDALIERGNFRFPAAFVSGILSLVISHLDTLVTPGMSREEISRLADNLVDMLKNGLVMDSD